MFILYHTFIKKSRYRLACLKKLENDPDSPMVHHSERSRNHVEGRFDGRKLLLYAIIYNIKEVYMFGIADNHDFLVAIGIENAPNRDAIVANLEKIAQQKLTIKISEKLSPAQLEEFNSIIDEGQAANWLAINLPDLPNLVTESLSELKDEILSTKAKVLGG